MGFSFSFVFFLCISKEAKYLGALVTYYDTGSVMETLSTDKVTSKQPDFNR
jgi:hypothetical protein